MRILLGVGGGIAAYKSAELARALMERGARVEVVMTRAAQEFVQPLTFASLTGNPVVTGLFAPGGSPSETLSSAIEHIRAAQDNDVLVIAPATADLMAKFAHGIADDFLTTAYLAFTGPVVIAPAMNTNMWNHPATQQNVAVLRARGHRIVEPGSGALACGMVGVGRLAEPLAIADAVVDAASTSAKSPVRDLDSEVVLITAGPTREPIDPVRYISNRSSGKMGYALAEAAAARGARVILVSGPVQLPPPKNVEVVRVTTAREMFDSVIERMPEASIIIKSAAVADYRSAQVPDQKIKKTQAKVTLELEPTQDILAECGRRKGDRLLIGFAAETQNLLEESRRKLKNKNCDMVVGNLVSQSGIGFDSDQNEVTLVTKSGQAETISKASKRVVADRILDKVFDLRLVSRDA